ncbi:C40 family peptidase [Olivibacter sitiensis]|uniref:C40 family peptidase n=1 Tax=Olivibacter sitiensis TaxID=376470 RepID=UPI00040C5BA0|nr:NlpC/P60 family protein [Olivibacter sitiensis]
MKKAFLVLCFITGNLLSNAVQAQTSEVKVENPDDSENLAKEYFSQIMGVAISATTSTKLYQFVYDWIGTPYRLGGKTKTGIDCSRFAYELYEKVFNTSIGNNSRNIYTQVNPVSKSDLKPGDLVFFKIRSKNITHVGVYIGENKFAHASTSRGVMISNLEEAYWRRYYFNGGRMLKADAQIEEEDDSTAIKLN